MIRQKVFFQDLNRISYSDAWDYQSKVQNALIRNKLNKRDLDEAQLLTYKQNHYLLFCEHNHVYTLGKSGSPQHLLLSEGELASNQVEYFKINRGGDITYHGPGQITGYPIFDLDEFFTDVHKYVRMLEESVIRTLNYYGVKGERMEGFTGVWIKEPENEKPYRKICAIGVHLSRWVTMHGFAFNVNTDLSYFNNIVPCGISDEEKSVTSLQNELGRRIELGEVKMLLKGNFADLFEYEYLPSNKEQLLINSRG